MKPKKSEHKFPPESEELYKRQIAMLEDTITAYHRSSTRQGIIILTIAGVAVIFLLGMIYTFAVWEYESARGDALCVYVHSLEDMERDLLMILNRHDERYPDAEIVPTLDCD